MLSVITPVGEGTKNFCEGYMYISVYLLCSLATGESGNVPISELVPSKWLFMFTVVLSVLAVSLCREFSIVNSSKLVLSSKVLK